MSMRALLTAVLFTFASTLTACGGCGDDGLGDVDAGDDDDGDDDAPGAITNLSAEPDAPCPIVDLTWSNPSGTESVVVVRTVGADLEGAPEDGDDYAVGDEVGNGVVVYVGDDEAFSDDGAFFADDTRYTAFAASGGGSYSDPEATSITLDPTLGAQTGSLSIDLVSDVVTPTNPGMFELAATSTYDEGTDTVTVQVTVQNDACRAVHNAKLRVTAVGQGTPDGDAGFDGDQVLAYGPAALLDGATSEERTLTITGVDGTVDPLVVDLDLFDSPYIAVPGGYDEACELGDVSGTVGSTAVAMDLPYGGSDSTGHGGVFSPDGELYYTGVGQQPTVAVVDLATLETVATADLTDGPGMITDGSASGGAGSIGSVMALRESPDHRFLYALLLTGDHRAYFSNTMATAGDGDLNAGFDPTTWTTSLDIVRIDRATMEEVDRVALLDEVTGRPKVHMMAMTPDGTTAAVPVKRLGTVFIVDLTTMAVTEEIDTSARSTEPHIAELSPDGETVYLAYRGSDHDGPDHDEAFESVDIGSGDVTTIAVTTNTETTENQPGFIQLGADGKIYYGRKNATTGLSTFVDGTETESLTGGDNAYAMVFDPDGEHFYVWENASTITRRLVSDDSQVDFPSGQPAITGASGNGHHAVLSAF
jgi:hypothetical protein